jgi:hypothetical protein
LETLHLKKAMTLGPDQLLHLPFERDLSFAGLTYLCQELHRFPQINKAKTLKALGGTIASELALRRWLEAQQVTYYLVNTTPFTEPNRTQIILGGRRVLVSTKLLHGSSSRHRYPGDNLLKRRRWVHVPLTTQRIRRLEEGDLCVFSTIHERTSGAIAQKVYYDGLFQPKAYLAIAPGFLRSPKPPWKPIRAIRLTLKSSQPLCLDLAAVGREHGLEFYILRLSPSATARLREATYSIQYLRSKTRPSGEISLQFHRARPNWNISPDSWLNLWLDAEEIVFLGWITLGDLRARAARTRAPDEQGQRRISTTVLSLPTHDLKPMKSLINYLQENSPRFP